MPASYLYHAYNIKGVKYKSTEFVGSAIILHAETTGETVPSLGPNTRIRIYRILEFSGWTGGWLDSVAI